MKKIGIRILVVVSLISFAGCASSKPTPKQVASADYGSYPSDYQQIIKDYLAKVLFDCVLPVCPSGEPA